MSAFQQMLAKIWGAYDGLSLYELTFRVNFALLKGEEMPTKTGDMLFLRIGDPTAAISTG